MMKNNKGFTLLEVMLVVAVLGILFSVLYTAMNFNTNLLLQKNKAADGHQQAMVAMKRITHLLRQYEHVDVVGNNIRAEGFSVLNFAHNTTPRSDCKYYFLWDEQRQIGELRNSADDVVVEGLKNIDFSQSGDTFAITITAVDPASEHGFTLTTSLRTNRHFSLEEE